MRRDGQVGFSQRIRLEWLEYLSGLMLQGYSNRQITEALNDLLRERVSVGGTGERTTRDKAVTILMRIWANVPAHLIPFRDDGLHLLQRLPTGDRLAVHWGMSMAVYPFWSLVAETVGRLLRLQGTAHAAQVQRRMREQLGERDTVSRATRRVLRSFIDWGILQETSRAGVYQAPQSRVIRDCELGAWLMEATLIAHGATSGPVRDLLRSPSLFPFTLEHSLVLGGIKGSRLEQMRQGLDEDVVSFRLRSRSEQRLLS